MKVRIYPPKTEIANVLQERIGQQNKLLADDESELAKITNSKIIRPGQDVAAKHQLQQRKEYIAQLENQFKILNSHEPPEVMVELEV